ncbi:MAG: diacylglycerol kinase family protein [Phycisphaerales bacterium]
MNIGLIINPKSGRNKATMIGAQCERILRDRKHSVGILNTQQTDSLDQEIFDHADRLVIIGGDGTVHHALPNLIKHQKPFIHLATGTSNLISKELKMPRNLEQCIQWVEQGGSAQIDVPTLDTVPFLIMCNFGMDASVIHRFQSARKRSGGFRNYIVPVIQESLQPNPARITINVPNFSPNPITLDPGNLTIANMHSSALAIDPCPHADPTDGLLDILGSSCSTTISWTLQTLMHRLRLNTRSKIKLHAHTIQISVAETESRSPVVVQVDGEIANTPQMPEGRLQPGCEIKVEIGNHSIPHITAPHFTAPHISAPSYAK